MSATENLIKAIDLNDVKNVIKCIEKGADVNAKDSFGFPIIYNAVCNKKREEVAEILINNPNINLHVYTPIGLTPCYVLIHDSRLEIFEKFIKVYNTKDLKSIHEKFSISAFEKAQNVYSHLLKIKEVKNKEGVTNNFRNISENIHKAKEILDILEIIDNF